MICNKFIGIIVACCGIGMPLWNHCAMWTLEVLETLICFHIMTDNKNLEK